MLFRSNMCTADNPDMSYIPGVYRNHTYSALAVVSQPLYTGGALQAQKAMAKADNKMAQLSEELTLQQINYQADAVYWNASSSEAMYKASEEYKDIVQQQYQVIEERFNDGLTSRSDLLMIATRLQEAELQLIGARQNKEIALQALNILCGRDPKTPEEGICPIGAVCENIKPLDRKSVV